MGFTFVYVLYCIEAGIFFLIAPWTRFWMVNPLLHSTPWLSLLADNGFFRGFVSGFGMIHLMFAFRQLRTSFAAWQARRDRS